jgi:D-lyxose ketol-isomerase
MIVMLTEKMEKEYKKKYLEMYEKAGIYLSEKEKGGVEPFDFWMGVPDRIGSAGVTYFNSERCCARELCMLPWQTIPEHRHPPVENCPGKEETFRCRWGRVYLYVEGEKADKVHGRIPEGKEDTFTVFHEIILDLGQQYTLAPNTLHWFQGGPEGCVVSEFSTVAKDAYDIYTADEIMKARRESGYQMGE